MIAVFLALTLLAMILAVFWVMWWLLADLFTGASHATAARIIVTDEAWHASSSIKRTAISP